MNRKTATKLRAFCWANGRIEFQDAKKRIPKGAIGLVTGAPKTIRTIVGVLARESYPSTPGGKDTFLLIPGIPEASTDHEKISALERFQRELKKRLNRSAASKSPEISITISGARAAGKTTLAHAIGKLLQADHTVEIFDPSYSGSSRPLKPESSIALNFKERRKVVIRVSEDERTCVHCGCTDSRACPGGCSWIEIHKATPTGVCSRCADGLPL